MTSQRHDNADRPASPACPGRRQFLAAGVGGLAALGLGGIPARGPVTAPAARLAAAAASPFGYSSGGGYFTASTGAGLTFKIRQSNGDMTSLNLGGTELQDQSSFSQVGSGLGTGAAVSAYQTGNYIVITSSVTNWYSSGTLRQYIIVRLGVLYGPYALMVAGTSVPAAPDLGFMDQFGFAGQVPASGHGYVAGKAAGVPGGVPAIVGFASSTAQYWAAAGSTGGFSSPAMKPGTYSQTLYQGELAVATRTVTVTAGSTNTGQNITSAWFTPASPVFRIGAWDGAPTGFRNGPRSWPFSPAPRHSSSRPGIRRAPPTAATPITGKGRFAVHDPVQDRDRPVVAERRGPLRVCPPRPRTSVGAFSPGPFAGGW